MTQNGEATRTSKMAAIIQASLDRGESYRSMAERAHRAGREISHAYINSLYRGHVAHAPNSERMEALAVGLSLPIEQVRAAVFYDWYGYEVGGLATGESFPMPAGLSDDERAEIDTLVRAWLIARRNG